MLNITGGPTRTTMYFIWAANSLEYITTLAEKTHLEKLLQMYSPFTNFLRYKTNFLYLTFIKDLQIIKIHYKEVIWKTSLKCVLCKTLHTIFVKFVVKRKWKSRWQEPLTRYPKVVDFWGKLDVRNLSASDFFGLNLWQYF